MSANSAKVKSKYHPAFIEYLKSLKAKWDPEAKVWSIPANLVSKVEAKAKELGVQGLEIELPQAPAKPAEGAIRMRLSRDGRFVLINVNLIAFAEDVKAMLEGRRKTVRFRILPPQQGK